MRFFTLGRSLWVTGFMLANPHLIARRNAEDTTPAMFLTVFGFAFIWHIWWLVGASLVATIAVFVRHAARDDQGYMVPAEEVARIEGERMQALAKAGALPAGARVESFERV